MSKTRTFIGIAPRPEVVERATRAITRLRRFADSVKWVEPQNLHWTLHFLGEISDQEIYEVCQAAERSASEVEPFGLTASGVGAFPSNARPRTLWIGAGQGAEGVSELYDALDKQLKPLGFRGESRQFVPHLTLGRAGRGIRAAETAVLAEELEKLVDYDGQSQWVDEATIYASRLRREGPEYAVLARVSLD